MFAWRAIAGKRYPVEMKFVSLPPLALAAILGLGGCVTPGETQPPPAASQTTKATPACAGQPLRKVLVTAFPLRYPEQLKSGEYMGWAQTTGAELARVLGAAGRVRVAAAPEDFPFADPAAAPEVERTAQGTPAIVAWARRERAQYVLAGVFQDFGTARKWQVVPERQMRIEAYLYDGIDGRLLAHRPFSRQLILDGDLPKNVAPGTRAFADSRLGHDYSALLADIGRWATDAVACRPFPLRITRIDGARLHLDAGSDSGLVAGAALSTSTRPETVVAGGSLNRKQVPMATIRQVGPDASVAEIPRQRNPPKFSVGDILYVPDPPGK